MSSLSSTPYQLRRLLDVWVRVVLIASVVSMAVRLPIITPADAASGTWATVTSPTSAMITDVAALSAANAWTVGSSGTLLRWNGTQWATQESPTSQWLWGVDASSASNVWVVGDAGTVLRWNGTAWSTLPAPTTEHLLGVSVLSSDNVWMVGEGGSIYQWDGSDEWTAHVLDGAANEIFYDIDMTSATNGWIAGSNGALWRWDGSTWTSVSSGTTNALVSVAARTASDAWVVGEQGTIRHWNGSTWTTVSSPTTASLLSVAMRNATEGWITGDDGTLLATMNGSSWTSETSPTEEALVQVGLEATGAGWAVGTNGTIVRHEVPPSAPTLTAPSGTIEDSTPIFTWSSVSDATSYTVNISSNESFTNPTPVTGLGSTSYTVDPALVDGTYYWRVRAVGPGGESSWSSSLSFTVTTQVPEEPDTTPPTVPALSSPTNAALVIPTATLSWQPSTDPEGGAVRYTVTLAKEPTFVEPLWTSADLETTTVTIPSGAIDAGSYYWRVRAADAVDNQSAPSSYRQFTVLPALGTVSVIGPASGAVTNASSVEFSWNALDYAEKYVVEVDAPDAGFQSSTRRVEETTGTSASLALPSGTYEWRVVAENARGRGTAPESGRVLTVDRDIPAAVQLREPIGGAIVETATPTLIWNASTETDVVGYEVEVHASGTLAAAFVSVTQPQYVVTSPLGDGAYAWRVRALDSAGNVSPLVTESFTVKVPRSGTGGGGPVEVTPGSFTLSEPARIIDDATPRFAWTASTNANAYEVRILRGETIVQTMVAQSGETSVEAVTPLSEGAYTWVVTAYNGSQTTSAGSRSLTIDTSAPTRPELVQPVPNAEELFPITFTWEPATDLSPVTYTLQVDDDHFSIPEAVLAGGADVEAALAKSLEVVAPGLATTSYPVTGGLREGVSYRWRVRATDAVGHSTISEIRDFSIPLPTQAPGAFSLTAPIGTVSIVKPTFVWTASPFVARYELRIQGTGAQSARQWVYPADGQPALVATTFSLSEDLPLGTYTWHVRAKNSAGETFSETKTITVATGAEPSTVILTAPANQAMVGGTPLFQWEPVQAQEAATYTVTVNGTPVATNVTTTSFQPQLPLTEGRLEWQVQAVTTTGVTVASDVRSVTVDRTAPAAPQITQPADGAREPIVTDLRWQSVADPSTPIRYEVVLDDEVSFSTPVATIPFERVQDTVISTAAFSTPLVEGRTYYWRVSARDAAGNVSAPSTSRSFVTGAASAVPGPVTLVLPLDAAIVGGRPFFDWSDARGAHRYSVRLQDRSTGTTRIFDSDISQFDMASRPGEEVLPAGTYQWTVQGVNDIGGGPVSSLQTFVVDGTPPARPGLLTPSDGERRGSVCTPFAWSAAEEGTVYDFELDPNRETFAIDRGARVVRRALTTTALEQALASGVYAWRVRAIDAVGNVGAWSAVRSVSVEGVSAAAAAQAICASVPTVVTGGETGGVRVALSATLVPPTTFATNKPSLRGTLSAPNTTARVFIDAQPVANVSVDARGMFQFDVPIRLPDGEHTVQFAVETLLSKAIPFRIDTTAPAAPIVEDVSVIRQQISDVPGTMDVLILVLRARVDAETVDVALVDPATNEVMLRQDAPSNRLFTATVDRHALAPGGHTLMVVARDAYGNASQARAEYLVTTEIIAFACSDAIDNDDDGKIDYPLDPGCSSYTDTDENDSAFVTFTNQKTVKAVTDAVTETTRATVTLTTETTKEAVRKTIEQTAQVAEVTERVVETAQPVAVTTLTAAAPIMTVASPLTAASLPAIPSMAMNGLSWLFSALGIKRKRKEPWGVVYDAITKEPIGLAIIRLYESVGGKLIATQVTDQQGRFEFLAKAGTYRIEVVKTPFVFPSKLISGAQDGEYTDVYRGGEVTVREGQPMHVNIPVDPEDPRKHAQALSWKQRVDAGRKIFQKFSLPIMVAGTAFAIIMFAFSQTQFNFLILLVYVVMAVFQILIVPQKKQAWGTVFDATTLEPVPLAIISVIDPAFKRVMKSRLTDYHGRFSFLPDPGSYQLRVTKQGYVFPSTISVSSRKFKNLYHGETITIEKKKSGKIAADIPVDRANIASSTPQSTVQSSQSVTSVAPSLPAAAPTGALPGIAGGQPSSVVIQPSTPSSGPVLPGTGGMSA